MKRLLFLVLLLLGAGAALGLAALHDPGYVLISWGLTSVETSLWLAALAWLLSLVLAMVVFDLLFRLLDLQGWWARWSGSRRLRRSQHAFGEATVLLERGEWQRAERLFFSAAKLSAQPLPAYLAAARAAARGEAYDRAEQYLVLAEEHGNRLAVGLARARFLVVAGRWERAAALLARLQERYRRDAAVLKLRVEVLVRLQRWGELADILPGLPARRDDDSRFCEIERKANREAMRWIAVAGQRGDRAAAGKRLQAYWEALPKRLRGDDEMVAAYAGELIRIGADDAAETLLADTLARRWSNACIDAYGRARSTHPDQALARAEAWRERHASNPALMLALGRLYLQNRRWLDARASFEATLALRKSPEAYAELVRLLVGLRDPEAARCMVDALGQLDAGLPDLPLP